MSAKNTKKSYDINFKLEVINFAEENNRNAGRKFNVDESQARRWRQKLQFYKLLLLTCRASPKIRSQAWNDHKYG